MKHKDAIIFLANLRVGDTLKIIRDHIPILRKFLVDDIRSYLILTHQDEIKEGMKDDLFGIDINELMVNLKIEEHLRIGISEDSKDTLNSVIDLINRIIDTSEPTKTTITKYKFQIKEYIDKIFTKSLDDKELQYISPEKIHKDIDVPLDTIKYYLEELDNRGEIEYLKLGNIVAIRHEIFNGLKSSVPTYIKNKDGMIDYKSLIVDNDPTNENYIKYILKSLVKSGFCYITNSYQFMRPGINYVDVSSLIIIPLQLSNASNVDKFSEKYSEIMTSSSRIYTENIDWLAILNLLEGEYNISVLHLYANYGLFVSSKAEQIQIVIELYSKIDRSGKLDLEIRYGGIEEKSVKEIIVKLNFFFSELEEIEKTPLNNVLEDETRSEVQDKEQKCTNPTVYISYAHGDTEYQNWIKELAEKITSKVKFDVKYDQDLKGDDDVYEFMDRLYDQDVVLSIINDKYLIQARNGKSGVSYELRKIRKLIEGGESDKVIVLLRNINHSDVPSLLNSKFHINMSKDKDQEESFKLLARSMWAVITNENNPPLCSKPYWIE